jgi:hypothetical protein
MQYQRASAKSQKILETIGKIRFYGLTDIKPKDVPQDWVNNTLAAAEKLLQHRYTCLAVGHIDLGEEINWNREYKRGIDTPLRFGPWMDYCDSESYGDFKYFWELPRLQHLITLAKAYYLTGEEKYARETVNQIKGFIEQSPYLLGVNWIMPMELAIRLISLCWMTAFLKKYLINDPGTCGLMESIVRSHTDYVAKNFSRFSSANNHLVAEAVGVFIASICFPLLPKAEEYRTSTHRILCREITRQFYADGVNKEQTTHYHIACYNCFLLAGLLGRANGFDFPSEYWQRLEEAANFIFAITTDSDSVPHIGDSDDGKTIMLSETHRSQVRSLLATATVLFNRSDFKAKAREFDEMSLWLLGNAGKAKFQSLPELKTDGEKPLKFDEGGYYILQADQPVRTKLVFDAGPIGLGSIAAHGHADSLSFVLYVGRREFFIDPGTYTFVANNPYRNYFRSTAAHNTIVVDGLDQSQMAGPFLWTRKAESVLEEFLSTESYDRVVASHNGYSSLFDPVVHRRTIEFDKKHATITIRDAIEAKNRHKVTSYFHLAPNCHVQLEKSNQLRITNEDYVIRLITDQQLRCEIIKAGENPICGWASDLYDRKLPTNTIVCEGVAEAGLSILTKIHLQ